LPADVPSSAMSGQSGLPRSDFECSYCVETDQTSEEEGKTAAAEAMALHVRAAGGWGRGGRQDTGSWRWKRERAVPHSNFLPDSLDMAPPVSVDKNTPAPPAPKQQQLRAARASHGSPCDRGRHKVVEGARVARHPQLEWRLRQRTIRDKAATVMVARRTIKKV
jgi:hypothetical protein